MSEVDAAAYEDHLERRVDGHPRKHTVQTAGRRRSAVGGAALMTAVALGFQQVFDPPAEDEIILEVESTEPLDDRWVTFEHDPGSVSHSRAHVRPWLAPAH